MNECRKTSSKKIAVVVGTRPEIIKMQPIVKELEKRKTELKLLFIHTKQHYDWNMSGAFLNELLLPKPDIFLNVGPGSHGVQTARILARCEKVFKKEKPDLILVEGDTNSALGSALAAAKLGITVGHVEAGCRVFDRKMPEEINRVVITDLSTLHFAPTKTCVQNLLREGISKKRIYLTGHPLVDLLHEVKSKINQRFITKFDLKPKEYYFVTLHRAENVDSKIRLKEILTAFSELVKFMPIIFPIHPRTSKSIRKFRLEKYLKGIIITEPLKYLETLSLIKYAKLVLTDSGGVQQEATLLGTPCVTLRGSTEWIETVNYGVNFLAKSQEKIISTCKWIEDKYDEIISKFSSMHDIFGKPYVSKRIVDIIVEQLNNI